MDTISSLFDLSALTDAPPTVLAPVFVAGQTIRDDPLAPELVLLPRGSFLMGSPENEAGRWDEEGPQHQVTIDYDLAVGKYPVTFEEWDAFAAETGGYQPDDAGWGRGRRPVINVSWDDAQAYVRWLSQKTGKPYRLLSESEWEYAARAGTSTPFSTGQTITTGQANFDGNYTYNGSSKGVYREKTVSVGSFAANAFGLYDMHGNVHEWVQDCWTNNYNGAPNNGGAVEGNNCASRVLRGGSWNYSPGILRSAYRNYISPVLRVHFYGFRVARTLP